MDRTELNTISGAVLFGSLWGMSEATLGVFLHLIYFPYKGAVMLSIGALLMLAAVRAYRPKNVMRFSLLMGVVASILKGFDVFLVGPEMMVIRPMIAIIIEALAFVSMVKIVQIFRSGDMVNAPVTGMGFSYLSYLAFGFVFTYLGLGSKFWLNKTLEEFLSLVIYEGSVAAVLCSITALVGYKVGHIVSILQKSRFYYPVLTTSILLIWILGIAYS